MSKPIDYDNLRDVVQAGTAQACRDAGMKFFSVSVEIIPVLVVVKGAGPALVPETKVQVLELTEEQAKQVLAEDLKLRGN